MTVIGQSSCHSAEGEQSEGNERLLRVALAGNPNTGKTTLFNRLTGLDQKVGNYPGITVDRHEGLLQLPDGARASLLDIPGTYSLSARSEEEQLAIQSVAGLAPEKLPDLIVAVVDATQLTRNLYLVLQLLETGTPLVIALTMKDMLSARGLEVDAAQLSKALGVPVVPVVGVKGTGIEELRTMIASVLADPSQGQPGGPWHPPEGGHLAEDVQAVLPHVPAEWSGGKQQRAHSLALWALLSLGDDDELRDVPQTLRDAVQVRHAAAAKAQREIDAEVIGGRYAWIDEQSPRFLHERPSGHSWSERLDALLLNPVLGFIIFLTAMGVLFQSLFTWAGPAIDLIGSMFDAIGGWVKVTLPAGIVRDFITEGLIAGVGSVVVFLPQILLLFFFIGLMEDSGYMARVAFLMDRIMKALGLHGRAFVPMLSGFACAIPAVMATRTMERKRDRYLTMMVVPLMTCSARLPVYTLVIAALFPPSESDGMPVGGLLMVGMYLFSTLVALVATAVLGRTLFKGPRVPLILELPPYRWPHWPSVIRSMWQKGRVFLTEAGTVILACTIGLWLLLSFPRQPELDVDYAAQRQELETSLEQGNLDATSHAEQLAAIDSEETGAQLRASYGGRLGRFIEPTIEPLGFDWKIGIGLIGAFAAREVFVSTLGLVYGIGGNVDESSVSLRDRIQAARHPDGRRVYTPLVGLSLMIFFALACQCLSTLAAVKRETQGYRWPVFMLVYMTVLAWVASFVTYQGGLLLGFE